LEGGSELKKRLNGADKANAMRLPSILFEYMFFVGSVFAQQPLRTIMQVQYWNSDYALGRGMIGLGDINNDGKPDFAVSAYNIRKTFIYFGGKGVLDSVPDVVIPGGGMMEKGDFNGDGKMDLFVAAPDSQLGQRYIYVYFGKAPSPIALDTLPDLIIRGDSAWEEFPYSFAGGDFNHDGFDDLVVSTQQTTIGKVYLFMGKASPNANPDYEAVGDTIASFYGVTVKAADINGDGICDLAISSDDRRGFQTIDIFYGHTGWTFSKSGFDQRLDSREGTFSNTSWVAFFNLVDVNGDGKADVSFSYGDSACFFYGRSDSIQHKPDIILTSPNLGLYGLFEGPAYGIGDINNDGKNDFALTLSPGGYAMCLAVYVGQRIPGLNNVAGRCVSFVASSAFSPIVALGDVNGDGVNDFGTVVPYDPLGIPPEDGYFMVFSGDTTFLTSVGKVIRLPGEFSLQPNYPNPFNPATTIEFTVTKTASVLLIIYDVSGKEITRLVDAKMGGGIHKVK
jgi:hypothetical protein